MLLDLENHEAHLSFAEFESLAEYSHTLPTGTTPGKIWKRKLETASELDRWMLGQYGQVQETSIEVHWYEVFIETEQARETRLNQDEES